MAEKSLTITPPSITRQHSSSADSATVKAMASQVAEGTWVTDGTVYSDGETCGNAMAVYKRALSVALGVEPHKIKSRSWGQKGDTIVTDKATKADWRFSLTVDPNRVKRTRKPKATA